MDSIRVLKNLCKRKSYNKAGCWERSENNHDQVIDAAKLLSVNPRSTLLQIKKIKGAENLYRLRMSDYRLVYDIQDQKLVILVIRIGHRKYVYRNI